MSTSETIWHCYQNSTAEDDFKLMIRGEVPEFEDVMEELDFYDDKFVVFQAVATDHAAAIAALNGQGGKDAPIVLD